MRNCTFKRGDIVRKKHGSLPWKITDIYGAMAYGKYLKSGSSTNSHMTNLVLYESHNNIEEESTKDMAPAIYKITLEDRETYGIKVGENSLGQYLMEEKGTTAILVVSKESVEEVLPYTFAVRISGNTQHFTGTAGSVEVGDLLIYTPNGIDRFTIGMVVEIDTKHKGAKIFKGRKIVTEKI